MTLLNLLVHSQGHVPPGRSGEFPENVCHLLDLLRPLRDVSKYGVTSGDFSAGLVLFVPFHAILSDAGGLERVGDRVTTTLNSFFPTILFI